MCQGHLGGGRLSQKCNGVSGSIDLAVVVFRLSWEFGLLFCFGQELDGKYGVIDRSLQFLRYRLHGSDVQVFIETGEYEVFRTVSGSLGEPHITNHLAASRYCGKSVSIHQFGPSRRK